MCGACECECVRFRTVEKGVTDLGPEGGRVGDGAELVFLHHPRKLVPFEANLPCPIWYSIHMHMHDSQPAMPNMVLNTHAHAGFPTCHAQYGTQYTCTCMIANTWQAAAMSVEWSAAVYANGICAGGHLCQRCMCCGSHLCQRLSRRRSRSHRAWYPHELHMSFACTPR